MPWTAVTLACARRIVYAARAMRGLVCIVSLVGFVCGACSSEIGDSCQGDLDCDVQANRRCVRNWPGGYCSVQGCEPGSCKAYDDSVCVTFRPWRPRLQSTWCLKRCKSDNDCRDEYICATRQSDRTYLSGAADTHEHDGRFCTYDPSALAEPSSP
ncbi:MAG: hypothetical protein MJD61_10565 [Proteobacteria bacterium]|nr:hypothetical protein [Pseudomonadota bacterium]